MRILSTRVHGIADYAMGLLLILSPYVFGFANGGIAQGLPIVLGIAMIGLALLTKYEFGAVGIISMPLHLGIDIVSGILLAASPWLFGFADQVYLPHLILGLIEIGTAAITQTAPSSTRQSRSEMRQAG
jgi:hypothetical protein